MTRPARDRDAILRPRGFVHPFVREADRCSAVLAQCAADQVARTTRELLEQLRLTQGPQFADVIAFALESRAYRAAHPTGKPRGA